MPPGDADAYHVELRVGDTFPIGSATWRLVAVENPGTWDYVVGIERVPGPDELSERAPVNLDLERAEQVGRVLELVRFEPRLDDIVVDKITQAALDTRMLHEPPARIAEAVAAALASTVRLTSLVPGLPFEENEVRDFLGRLSARLDAARPWPEWSYERVDAAQWNPARVQPVARINLPPLRVGNLLSVPFERVERDGVTMDVAVLRLAAGPVVALAQEVGSRSGGTVLLRHPGESVRAEVAEVLQARGIAPDSITWLDDAQSATGSGW